MRHLINVTMCAIMALVLTACASKYGEQHTAVNYYPACYRPIQDLRANENNVAKSTAVGAGLGAAGGALIGLLTTGKWQGALMGAAMGGVGGTMVGNMYGRKQQERDDNIRLNSYLQDLDGDISNLDATSAAAKTSLQCYDRAFNALLAAIKARQITRESAAMHFREILNGREEAIAILGNAAEYGNNLTQEYERAFANEEQQVFAPQRVAQNRGQAQRSAQTLGAAKRRSQRLKQQTQQIREARTVAQNDSAMQIQEINNALREIRE